MSEEILIEKIKSHPCLFDKGHCLYKNKLAKEKAWMDVASSAGLPEDVCQTKWKSLRDKFVKEVNKKPKSGSEAVENCNWKFYEHMLFLKKHVAPRRTISNTFKEETFDFSASEECFPPTEESRIETPISLFEGFVNDYENSRESASTSTPRPKKGKFEDASQRFEGLIGAVQSLIQAKTTESKPPNAAYFEVLDGFLQRLPESRQSYLKVKFLSMANEECAADDF